MIEPGNGLVLFGIAQIVKRVLGPTLDYFGEETKELAKKQVENLKRIFINADKKLGNKTNQPGRVPPRILKRILDEGSFCEDELTADYFGGVLASSRSEVDRDDRGATIISLLSSLSSYQIRCHYIFYFICKKLFDGQKLTVEKGEDREKMAVFINYNEFKKAMGFSEKENTNLISSHIFTGLSKHELIAYHRRGSIDFMKKIYKDLKEKGIVFHPSQLGVELFLWAHGKSEIAIKYFLNKDVIFDPIKSIEFPEYPLVLTYTSTNTPNIPNENVPRYSENLTKVK